MLWLACAFAMFMTMRWCQEPVFLRTSRWLVLLSFFCLASVVFVACVRCVGSRTAVHDAAVSCVHVELSRMRSACDRVFEFLLIILIHKKNELYPLQLFVSTVIRIHIAIMTIQTPFQIDYYKINKLLWMPHSDCFVSLVCFWLKVMLIGMWFRIKHALWATRRRVLSRATQKMNL